MVFQSYALYPHMTVANKIVVLQDGIVEQVGSPMALYHHPRNRFVAGFIGSPTMNFTEVEVIDVESEEDRTTTDSGH